MLALRITYAPSGRAAFVASLSLFSKHCSHEPYTGMILGASLWRLARRGVATCVVILRSVHPQPLSLVAGRHCALNTPALRSSGLCPEFVLVDVVFCFDIVDCICRERSPSVHRLGDREALSAHFFKGEDSPSFEAAAMSMTCIVFLCPPCRLFRTDETVVGIYAF